MTFYVENEVQAQFPFPVEETVSKVLCAVLAYEQCPYEAEVNIVITDLEGIREYNRSYRGIDKETDVLSFPAVDCDKPSDFAIVEQEVSCYVNPDTQELMLGDILLCADRVKSQAEEYGHSELREFAFLLAHSMLHLLGYDHMEREEEKVMFARQEEILGEIGITR